MDDQNQNMNTPVMDQPVVENTAPMTTPSAQYGSFGARLVAALLDGILISIAAVLITMPLNALSGGSSEVPNTSFQFVPTLLTWIYMVYFTAAKGATLGKKAMNLRVQNMTTGANLTYVEAFLREVVGKFLSGIVLLLGYFWMLWDPNKQTWHDKLAKSVVVKTK